MMASTKTSPGDGVKGMGASSPEPAAPDSIQGSAFEDMPVGDADHPDDASSLPDIPQTIAFKHPFFTTIKGSHFLALEDTAEPVMIMPLETGDVSLKLSGIRHELNLEPGDADAHMLDIVAEGLKFVRGLKIGDPVPSELTSGRASWSVTERHLSISRSRLTMQLVSWIGGEEHVITDVQELEQIVQDPHTRQQVTVAFEEAAEHLGVGRENKEKVILLVENLAEELSYIEALRERFESILAMSDAVDAIHQKYRSEQSLSVKIQSIRRLFRIASRGLKDTFDQVDAQTGEILSVLKNIAPQTRFIRQSRDDLHRRLWAWDGLIAKWDGVVVKRSRKNEGLLDELYHFLAQRFLPADEWELFSKAQEKQMMKRTTERRW